MNSSTSQAIERAGGLQALAQAVGVSYQAIQKWRNTQIPAHRVIDVERVTGISRYDLRPDIFGEAPDKAG